MKELAEKISLVLKLYSLIELGIFIWFIFWLLYLVVNFRT